LKDIITSEILSHNQISSSLNLLIEDIHKVATCLISSLKNKNKILIFGNGGSASDANHIAAELVGRYKIDKTPLPAISLSSNSSIITSIGNDYGYDYIFSKQIQAIAKKGDSVIAISTSGNSKNILNALIKAEEIGCHTIGLSGANGGYMKKLCDINININSKDTPRIQEAHIFIGHTLCSIIEKKYNI